MKKIKADMVAGALFMIFGLFFLIQTASNPQMSFIATTSDGVPGGGFFPYILSILIIIMGDALVVRGARNEGKKYVELTEENKKNLRILLMTVAGLIVFLAVWKMTAGTFGNTAFLICVCLFEIYLNKIFERTWKFTLIYSAGFTLFVYLVFSLGFKIIFNA